VTSEDAVAAAFAAAVDTFGGLDIVVSNAGIASSAALEDTTLAEWNRNHAILGTGYFLVARESFRVLKHQDAGGSIVFIASKNALVAGKNAAAYSSAKAAELHLARCLAEEGGEDGIRVNTVNPDAVLQGSKIWGSSVARGARRGVQPRPRRARRALPPAQHAQGQHLPRRHRRSRPALRVRAPLGQRAPATCSTSTEACLPLMPANWGRAVVCDRFSPPPCEFSPVPLWCGAVRAPGLRRAPPRGRCGVRRVSVGLRVMSLSLDRTEPACARAAGLRS
jgi:NAD(P)-dependent dehydrogenase (short-subunit alcohol dehydrogenase family)